MQPPATKQARFGQRCPSRQPDIAQLADDNAMAAEIRQLMELAVIVEHHDHEADTELWRNLRGYLENKSHALQTRALARGPVTRDRSPLYVLFHALRSCMPNRVL